MSWWCPTPGRTKSGRPGSRRTTGRRWKLAFGPGAQAVERALAAVKLGYLGSATLTEAFDNALPAALRDWLAQQPVTLLKEQLRDYALNQSFRRDLYAKGQHKPWPTTHQQRVRAVRIVANPSQPRPEAGQTWPIKGGSVELNGEPVFYTAVMDRLEAAGDAGLTLARLGRSLRKDGQPVTDAAERQAMLEAAVQAYLKGKRVLLKRLGAF